MALLESSGYNPGMTLSWHKPPVLVPECCKLAVLEVGWAIVEACAGLKVSDPAPALVEWGTLHLVVQGAGEGWWWNVPGGMDVFFFGGGMVEQEVDWAQEESMNSLPRLLGFMPTK